MTKRRGVGGTGWAASCGSGDGVRERLKNFSFGMSWAERDMWWRSGGLAGVGGGAAARVITDADSASRRSPIL